MIIYDVLKKLNISYEEKTHQAVYTVEEAKQINNQLPGLGCKNLFLKDKFQNYYLLVLEEDKKANFKDLEKLLETKNLKFASSEELKTFLNLEPGSVTPLAIIHDSKIKVTLIIDKELQDKRLLFHPNINTKTISISYEDLIKFIEYTNHKYILM